ncbi:MAG: glutamate-5-semialdehyde dehydrogenase [Clostridia bacterium]|nr:glutamate-5-semialdehyde dehydrogenase [Clostridia bacterium]
MNSTAISDREYIEDICRRSRNVSRLGMTLSSTLKNKALLRIADLLAENEEEILAANRIDVEKAHEHGIGEVMADRLTINSKRLAGISDGIRQVAALKDPVGEILWGTKRPNGLEIIKKRVPLGVIGIIYESRPNVTCDCAALSLKSGNAAILRGGSEAVNTNRALVKVIRRGLADAGIPEDFVILIERTDRSLVNLFMTMNDYVDILIPRGGKGLISNVVENSRIPVIRTGTGNCHTYIDDGFDPQMALDIVINAKTQRPSVCNAMETLLVSEKAAVSFLPVIADALIERGVELRGCEKTVALCGSKIVPASELDYETEYNDLILAVKVVSDVNEAIEHVNKYGSGHSEAIITRSYENAKLFQDKVDAACVYANCSTRFTDGFEFGFGAEIGISNQKLHARGPMGLEELTSVKYIINGDGQIRT